MKSELLLLTILLQLTACNLNIKEEKTKLPVLKVSENKHYLIDENGDPFFWLGDTGWLLFKKLNREDADLYLEDRRQKGFNVIQAMVLHDIKNAVNIYGDSALTDKNITQPKVTEGTSHEVSEAYDFWDHVDYIIDLAEKKGLYMALVPIWGSNVKNNTITPEMGSKYGKWIADRYKDKNNIIWLNGGDVFGTDSIDFWKALGSSLNKHAPNHLITFHPRGRMQSSMWFHNENWLDFNMVQSGHRNYEQDDTELNYGEDNWRYIKSDWNLTPTKPTLDGEPSYEGIPQGLHDTLQPYWTDADIRRYGYWSVFAGACGFTYGHNAVMQFFKPEEKKRAYGAKIRWRPALEEPGARQMVHLKELMLSRPYLDRIPDQSLITGKQGERYNHLISTRGRDYAFIYTYSGRKIEITMGVINREQVTASWFNPRNGEYVKIGLFENQGRLEFIPPGGALDGNDWVLVLDSVK